MSIDARDDGGVAAWQWLEIATVIDYLLVLDAADAARKNTGYATFDLAGDTRTHSRRGDTQPGRREKAGENGPMDTTVTKSVPLRQCRLPKRSDREICGGGRTDVDDSQGWRKKRTQRIARSRRN